MSRIVLTNGGPNQLWRRCCSNAIPQKLSEKQQSQFVAVPRELPSFAKPRGEVKPVFSLVKWKNGELLADYVLFEESMKKCNVSWLTYKAMTVEEIRIYLAHYKAVQQRKMSYKCPSSKKNVDTICQLLYNGTCCGEGCRHCPYELEGCAEKRRKSMIWNGAYYV